MSKTNRHKFHEDFPKIKLKKKRFINADDVDYENCTIDIYKQKYLERVRDEDQA